MTTSPRTTSSKGESPGRGAEAWQDAAIRPLAKAHDVLAGLRTHADEDSDPAETHFLDTLSSAVSVALENARLYEEQKEIARLNEALNRIERAMTSTLELEEVERRVVTEAASTLSCGAAILEYCEGDLWIPRELCGLPQSLLGTPLTDEEASLPKAMALAGRVLAIQDAARDARVSPSVAARFELKSALLVPLLLRGETLGALLLAYKDKQHDFSAPEIELGRKLSASVALALENARRYQEQRESSRLGEVLNDIAASLNSGLHPPLQQVLEEARGAVGCDAATLVFREGASWLPRYVCGRSAGLAREHTAKALPFASEAARTRDLVTYAGGAPSSSHPLANGPADVGSVLAMPLIQKQRVVAVLSFSNRDARMRFTPALMDFARKLAANLSLALENAALFAEQQRIVATLQQALIGMPARVEGVAFGHLHRSATKWAEPGGDFYDLFPTGDGRLGILMCDVSGKGVEATTRAALIRHAAKAYALEADSPTEVLAKVNRLLLTIAEARYYATAFLGIVDTHTGDLTYSSAGHPPAMLRRSDGRVDLLSSVPLVLGIVEEPNYVSFETRMDEGNVLLVYTDGATHARRNREFFGERRLQDLLGSCGEIGVAGVPEALLAEITRFTDDRLNDDIALLAVSLG